jgi:hypothetical protein
MNHLYRYRFASASNALHHHACQSTGQPGQRIHEYEPKRGNMLGFNNFRMVKVIELVSRSQKSRKYQRFQRFKFIVDVRW